MSRALPYLFAPTRDLRIHYTNPAMMASLDPQFPFPAAVFPNITTLAVIQDTDERWLPRPKPALRAGLAHLVQAPGPPSISTVLDFPEVTECPPSEPRAHWPGCEHGQQAMPYHPSLDTLWTTLESGDEIADLETTLAARAALGLPICRLVVALCYSPVAADTGLDDVRARLHALEAQEVVVMDTEVSSGLREVDWLVRLPERYELPSVIHREWQATVGDAGWK